jgi:putative ABC transport system permease protein
MKWMKLAFRNVLRNKRRSLVTIFAIGIGFAAISLYYGYIHYVYWALKVTAIHGEGLGHLRINKAGWHEKGKLEPENICFPVKKLKKFSNCLPKKKMSYYPLRRFRLPAW